MVQDCATNRMEEELEDLMDTDEPEMIFNDDVPDGVLEQKHAHGSSSSSSGVASEPGPGCTDLVIWGPSEEERRIAKAELYEEISPSKLKALEEICKIAEQAGLQGQHNRAAEEIRVRMKRAGQLEPTQRAALEELRAIAVKRRRDELEERRLAVEHEYELKRLSMQEQMAAHKLGIEKEKAEVEAILQRKQEAAEEAAEKERQRELDRAFKLLQNNGAVHVAVKMRRWRIAMTIPQRQAHDELCKHPASREAASLEGPIPDLFEPPKNFRPCGRCFSALSEYPARTARISERLEDLVMGGKGAMATVTPDNVAADHLRHLISQCCPNYMDLMVRWSPSKLLWKHYCVFDLAFVEAVLRYQWALKMQIVKWPPTTEELEP